MPKTNVFVNRNKTRHYFKDLATRVVDSTDGPIEERVALCCMSMSMNEFFQDNSSYHSSDEIFLSFVKRMDFCLNADKRDPLKSDDIEQWLYLKKLYDAQLEVKDKLVNRWIWLSGKKEKERREREECREFLCGTGIPVVFLLGGLVAFLLYMFNKPPSLF